MPAAGPPSTGCLIGLAASGHRFDHGHVTLRPPTPTQAWLAYERRSLGLSLREAAAEFGTSRSVLHRAERGGPNGAADSGEPRLFDRLAAAAHADLGSWPTAEMAMVNRVLGWWRQHPLDRLAYCLQTRRSDWQTPLRHVTRQLTQLPAVVGGPSALDLLVPAEGRDPPQEWTLACPWIREPCRVTHRHLGVLRLESELDLARADRASAIPDRLGRSNSDGLRIMHPRDLMVTLGWSPWLAAAVRAADLGGPIAGVGYPRRMIRRHHSMEVWEDFDSDEFVEAGDDLGEHVGVGLGEHAMTEIEDVPGR